MGENKYWFDANLVYRLDSPSNSDATFLYNGLFPTKLMHNFYFLFFCFVSVPLVFTKQLCDGCARYSTVQVVRNVAVLAFIFNICTKLRLIALLPAITTTRETSQSLARVQKKQQHQNWTNQRMINTVRWMITYDMRQQQKQNANCAVVDSSLLKRYF